MGKYDQTDYVKRAKKKYDATTKKENYVRVMIKRESHAKIKSLAEERGITILELMEEAINTLESKLKTSQ